MAGFKGAVSVDTERCKGCGVCVVNCPMQVLGLAKEVNGKGYNYAYMAEPDKCIGCASCGIVCPDGVISVYKVKL
ncbi:MAG: 4Fe-4S binding protein [Bacteroidales bacterium]|nr:4Fe-4S binding protein [Candidatus Limimorpha caballi]MCQ2306975.1 4Fe-4S binding protein [Bacteroidales bacterium]MDO5342224.1 4Fe-4S binding protein [Bacteroidia bacterium]MCQ2316458.1 4Fe-4S binding protein [Bacteroidales bacterium]MCQ2318537.1 4Fe-4S binding protein [Bacteroidales bacterium]